MLAVLAILIAATAAPPSQFDIFCSGTETTEDSQPVVVHPWSASIAIDLERKLYCAESPCTTPQSIFSVKEDEIIFRDRTSDRFFVNRSTGRVRWLIEEENRGQLLRDGNCSVSKFSGLPAKLF